MVNYCYDTLLVRALDDRAYACARAAVDILSLPRSKGARNVVSDVGEWLLAIGDGRDAIF